MREFKRDIAAADDRDMIGKFFQMEGFIGRDAARAPLRVRFARRIPAGGDEDGLRRDVAVRLLQMDGVRILENRAILEDGDAGIVQHAAIGARDARNIPVLVRDQRRPIEAGAFYRPAEAARVFEFLREAAGIDEELLGDAAAHDAGAAETVLFGDGDARAHLCADTRAARTPPEPAPMTKRSKSNFLFIRVCARSHEPRPRPR